MSIGFPRIAVPSARAEAASRRARPHSRRGAWRALLCRAALGTALLLGAGGAAALADPPGRVGRLSYMEGTVSFHTADQDQWSAAVLNYPVTTGTSFWTEPNSRAEIEVGAAEVRMDQSTELDVVRLDDAATQLQVDQGVVNVHLRSLPPGGVQVRTPQATVELVKPGSYHIDAGQPNGDTPASQAQVVVLEGEARSDGPRAALDVQPGEAATVSGNPVTFSLAEGEATPFDDWALARERREAAANTVRYVSPQVTGYQDLDDYGQWSSAPSYGAVWYPTAVPVGWAPYRYGHWAYVPPWGWTWIDDAPWGFAPFHYGRWVLIDGRWAWWPGVGVVAARPVYAPALVAFIGGNGWGVSLSIGSAFPAVGWVPLAPYEVFHPYYRTSPTYIRNVNITTVNKTVINNITVVKNVTVNKYVNQQAATVVPSAAFAGAAPVQRAALAVPRGELAQAHVTRTLAHLQPTPAARAGRAVPAAAEIVPRADMPANVAKGPVKAPASRPVANIEPQRGEAAAPHAPAANGPTAPATPKAPGPAIAPKPEAQHLAHAPTPPSPHAEAQDAHGAPKQPATHAEAQHAPGPPIHRAAVAHAPTGHATPSHEIRAPAREPMMKVQRPVQQTHLAPTAQGWKREASQPHAAPARSAPPAAHNAAPKPSAPANERNEHKQQ